MQQVVDTIQSSRYGESIASIPEYVTFESFFQFWVAYFFIVWITLILWVTKDVTIRSASILFQLMSILFVVILWPLWLILYLIVRPRNQISKKYIEEIENNLSILSHIVEKWKKGLLLCPKCSKQISHTSKVCPKCKTSLKEKCGKCKNIVLPQWKICLFCNSSLKKKKKKKK